MFSSDLYEIIVVDNNSADETARVVAKLNEQPGNKIRYIFESNPGLMYARHTGAKAAEGEILAYIDDDILVTPEWLRQLNLAYQEFDADCAGGKILIQWDRNPPIWVKTYENILGHLDLGPKAFQLRSNQSIHGGNFSIKKKRLFQIGGFNPDQIGNNLIGDGETGLCRKIHRAGWKMAWVPGALVWHQQIVEANGSLTDLRRRFKNNGVCYAYDYYRRTKCSKRHLLRRALEAAIKALKLTLRSVKHFFAKDMAYYKTELDKAFFLGKSYYYLRLVWDLKLRKFALQDDWINETKK